MPDTCKLRLRATDDGLSVVPDEGHSQHLTLLIRTREDFQVHTLPTGFFYRVQSREVVNAYMAQKRIYYSRNRLVSPTSKLR
ncbi:hypothetical protein V3C99_004997, partial [Haemonchus contortus]